MTSTTPPAVARQSRLHLLPLLILFVFCGFSACFAITLATQGEITIPTGNAPDQVLRIWLVMEARQRGVGISRAAAEYVSADAVAVRTTVSYMLWQGEGESAEYCLYYTRANSQSEWALTDDLLNLCDTP